MASSLPLVFAIFVEPALSLVPWIQYLPCILVFVPGFLSRYQVLRSRLRNLPGVPMSSRDTEDSTLLLPFLSPRVQLLRHMLTEALHFQRRLSDAACLNVGALFASGFHGTML